MGAVSRQSRDPGGLTLTRGGHSASLLVPSRRRAGGLRQGGPRGRLRGGGRRGGGRQRASLEDGGHRGAGAPDRHAGHQTLPARHHPWRSVGSVSLMDVGSLKRPSGHVVYCT